MKSGLRLNLPVKRRFAGRRFLFLQGLSTPMFFILGERLKSEGAEIYRVHICPGDNLFWPFWRAKAFRGRFVHWAGFVTSIIENKNITDLVLFGDCRPYHRVAIARARRRGRRVHVLDEGYTRPHWLTMIESGIDWRSAPAGPLRNLSAHDVAGGMARRVLWDVAFHIVNTALWPLYPGYRRHRPGHPAQEAVGWIRRLARKRRERQAANEAMPALRGSSKPFFLLPLQLDSDAQVRFRSSYLDMEEILVQVMSSFADHAPGHTQLVVKVHPLDNGVVDRREQVKRLARLHGLSGRVVFLDGGDLETLLEEACGVVVLNSTVGLSAVRAGVPTKVLGQAFYDCAGVTSPAPLDMFWTNPGAPEPAQVDRLVASMMQKTQINGSYFTEHGMALAVEGITERLSVTTASSA